MWFFGHLLLFLLLFSLFYAYLCFVSFFYQLLLSGCTRWRYQLVLKECFWYFLLTILLHCVVHEALLAPTAVILNIYSIFYFTPFYTEDGLISKFRNDYLLLTSFLCIYTLVICTFMSFLPKGCMLICIHMNFFVHISIKFA